MSKEKRSDLIIGIILLVLGGLFLAGELNFIPKLNDLMDIEYQWPFIVIGVGVFLFLLGLITHSPGMSIPACIVGGIGGILLWTNSTGEWEAWTYLWTLIPGFVGVGVIFTSLLSGETKGYREGLRLILVSAILFLLFLILFSGKANYFQYWPVLVILAGVWIIIQTIFRKK